MKSRTYEDMYKRLRCSVRNTRFGKSAAARGRQLGAHEPRTGTVAPEPAFAIPQHKTLRHYFTLDDASPQKPVT
jgi:hypothetical protein